eukprot:scaffold1833_cov145-Skeletonema_marinoi.AAC.3
MKVRFQVSDALTQPLRQAIVGKLKLCHAVHVVAINFTQLHTAACACMLIQPYIVILCPLCALDESYVKQAFRSIGQNHVIC